MTELTIETQSNGDVTAQYATSGLTTLNEVTIGDTAQITVEVDNATDFETLLSYQDYAGKYTVINTLDGKDRYAEFTPDTADGLVFGVDTGTDLTSIYVNGIWGLVSNITDARNTALNTNRISVELQVLGFYSDYTDHRDVEQDLKVDFEGQQNTNVYQIGFAVGGTSETGFTEIGWIVNGDEYTDIEEIGYT